MQRNQFVLILWIQERSLQPMKFNRKIFAKNIFIWEAFETCGGTVIIVIINYCANLYIRV